MAQFQILVGSVLGASEYVADALQEVLEKNGHQASIHLTPDLDEVDLAATLIVCTSTHGAGDLPDNIEPFAKQLKTAKLAGLSFLVVGLGDSSYDTFCNGAMQMEDLLKQADATLLTPAVHIDVLTHPIPEDNAVEWLQDWLEK
jgi:MioC protein